MKILENIQLKQWTTFKIGGPARFFCEPANKDEIIEALSFAKENNLPVFVLGLGANILFSEMRMYQ
jgi:UDP-N-acetylmuramate dehydrogenase